MQKIINGIALLSGVVSITVVGVAGYVYIRKDAIIENVKSKVMEAVMPDLGGSLGGIVPDFTGPAAPLNPQADAPAKSIIPEGTGLGIPNF